MIALSMADNIARLGQQVTQRAVIIGWFNEALLEIHKKNILEFKETNLNPEYKKEL